MLLKTDCCNKRSVLGSNPMTPGAAVSKSKGVYYSIGTKWECQSPIGAWPVHNCGSCNFPLMAFCPFWGLTWPPLGWLHPSFNVFTILLGPRGCHKKQLGRGQFITVEVEILL